jgi:hypothetical protein
MADAMIQKLPIETLATIIRFVGGEAGFEGRGSGQVRDLCVVSRQFRDATHMQWACIPQKKKRVNRKLVRAAPAAEEEHVDAEDGDVEQPAAVGEFVMEDELKLTERLRVGQVIVWRDLRHAQRCIMLNRTNLEFWVGIRAIFLSLINTAPAAGGTGLNMRLAHQVFAELYQIWVSLHQQNMPKPKLEWLRLECLVWGGIKNMDSPGMFYLSQLHGVPVVRFHTAPGRGISSFVAMEVHIMIGKRTKRPWKPTWEPTGLESPCKADWRVQARRKKRKGEDFNECYWRFLAEKYDKWYK